MHHAKAMILVVLSWVALCGAAQAQTAMEPLEMATVHRPPFAFVDDGDIRGFSIDLMTEIGRDIGRDIVFRPQDSFAQMLDTVKTGQTDGAIANISITTEREREMDFSQPIFASGIKILLPATGSGLGLVSALLTKEIGLIVLSGLALLMFGGFIMWIFERRHQAYFDKPAKEALFPSFWWALNLVVNGGFEERVPQSPFGRVFAVVLVVSSLFIVSIFVASITAATTVNALNSNVQNLRDLESKRVGTIEGSTSARFLDDNNLRYVAFSAPAAVFRAFEEGSIDAIVFDSPILAYYQQTQSTEKVQLLERTYRPENYGIVLQSGSALKEDIDQVLLKFRVDGTYDALLSKWFGRAYTPQ